MRWIVCVSIGMAFLAGGCRQDIKEIADDHVRNNMLQKYEKREAIPFFEQKGKYFDTDATTDVDQKVVLPLLKQLNELAPTEQWVMIRPEKKDSAFGVLIELPKDPHVVDQMAEAVQQADDAFSGFILQQWGHDWLLMDLIDEDSYKFLKEADPDIDKQR